MMCLVYYPRLCEMMMRFAGLFDGTGQYWLIAGLVGISLVLVFKWRPS